MTEWPHDRSLCLGRMSRREFMIQQTVHLINQEAMRKGFGPVIPKESIHPVTKVLSNKLCFLTCLPFLSNMKLG